MYKSIQNCSILLISVISLALSVYGVALAVNFETGMYFSPEVDGGFEFNSNGNGVFNGGGEDTPFKWTIKDNKIIIIYENENCKNECGEIFTILNNKVLMFDSGLKIYHDGIVLK
ncbi:MAG: hypothetical protein LBT86_02710 [Deltaproteobacteria bacterium]|jgi:hypothetical protein|nr:hypothetical protein [Deltaproteobacteria bacterium]